MKTILIAVVALLLLAGSALAQPNLIPNLPSGWSWPIVPRSTNDATLTNVPAPSSLGEFLPTYLNSAWRNIGTVSSGAFHNNTVLDGSTVLVDRSCASLAAGAASQGINGGPFQILGGRHTLELRVDVGGVVTESDESDNNIAHQWSWHTNTLDAGGYGWRAAPPEPQGGWSSIPAGQDKYDNCDGFGFENGTNWDVVYIWPTGIGADYDLRLFEHTSSVTDGFKTPIAWSTRRGRGVEAMIINAHNVGPQLYDVGVFRYSGDDDYYFAGVGSQTLAWGDSITVTFGQYEMVKAFDVTVPAAGAVSAWLRTTTTDPSVVLAWADRTFTRGSLTDLAATAATDAYGRLRLDVTATAAGSHGVVVFRDPDWGTGPRSFGLKVGAAKPDLTPYAPGGWHSPLVPRRTNDGTPTSVALPDTLPAFNTGPYYNFAVRNVGGATTGVSSVTQLLIDGTSLGSPATAMMNPGGVVTFNSAYAGGEVRAGRHSLGMIVNSTHTFTEATADNNTYGEQYCWAPVSVAPLTDMGWDPSPPSPSGGLQYVSSGEPVYFNNLARRLPTASPTCWWQGYIIAPLAGCDYDLQLHEALRGAKNGLGEARSASHWGSNQTDYVLVNLNLTPRRPFDISVTNYGGASSFHPHCVESTTLGTAGTLTLAPFTANYYELMQLREWYFTSGYWIIHLKNLSYNASKLGMTFHQADEVYTGKRVAQSVYPGAGGDVWMHVHVTQPGWCCLAVWAQTYDDGGGSMTYQLSMSPGGTPVPETPTAPAATRLHGASPNPFNPKTTVAFDLAATGRARLAVYDLRGALVRRLVDADLAAGRQQVAWDGRDEAGQPVPSGTYFARLEACGLTQTQKLALVR